jgi:hypothetical protein
VRRLAFAAVLVTACGSDPEGTITLTTGEELDALSRAPAPTTLVVETLAVDGKRTEIGRTALPADTIDLGSLPRADVGAISVRALDPVGKTLLAGETLFVQWGALELTTLEVFVQRTGELARLPRAPAPFDPASVTTVTGRYVMMARETSAVLYDLLSHRTLDGQTTLPRPARSMAPYGTTLVVVDERGASAVDLQLGRTRDLEPPAGGAFAEVAGGATIAALDGTMFVVGATRSAGGPTTRILRVGSDGNVTFANLAAAREGACATWLEGRGLVVYGGSATASGAEVLAPGAVIAAPLPLAPDPIRMCGVAALDSSHAIVAGAGGPPRVFDLACGAQCAPATWTGVVPLERAEIHPLAADAAFVTGDANDGTTHAYRISPAEVREIPLRVPRRGARLVALPTLAAALVGGGAGIEAYRE